MLKYKAAVVLIVMAVTGITITQETFNSHHQQKVEEETQITEREKNPFGIIESISATAAYDIKNTINKFIQGN